MSEDTAQALLPCPFCGHAEPSFVRLGTPRQSCIVECGWCGARHESSDEEANSGRSWNARAAISTHTAQAEAPVAPDREELLGDAIRALIRGDIKCSDDLPPDRRPVHVSARRAFGAVHAMLAAPQPPQPVSLTDAARDVLAERRRQVEAEGWTPHHDDEHDSGELALAAGAYAVVGCTDASPREAPAWWPWDAKWWKPRDERRNCVKAAALLLAEIERLDRAHGITPPDQPADKGAQETEPSATDWTMQTR